MLRISISNINSFLRCILSVLEFLVLLAIRKSVAKELDICYLRLPRKYCAAMHCYQMRWPNNDRAICNLISNATRKLLNFALKMPVTFFSER